MKTHKAKTQDFRPSILGYCFISLIKAYKLLLSPLIGWNCRFYPSCSSYALEAFQTKRFHYAFYLVLKRLLSCHPFHPGGFDPVPEKINSAKDQELS